MEQARQSPQALKVLYRDEASFYRQPTQAGLWAERGRAQPRVRWSYRSNRVVRVAGALEAVEGRLLYRLAPRLSVRELIRYYEHLEQAYPDCPRLCIVQDNWPHHSHPQVCRAVGRLARLELVFLPTYAPYLNPEEKVWRWSRLAGSAWSMPIPMAMTSMSSNAKLPPPWTTPTSTEVIS